MSVIGHPAHAAQGAGLKGIWGTAGGMSMARSAPLRPGPAAEWHGGATGAIFVAAKPRRPARTGDRWKHGSDLSAAALAKNRSYRSL